LVEGVQNIINRDGSYGTWCIADLENIVSDKRVSSIILCVIKAPNVYFTAAPKAKSIVVYNKFTT
jgi:hypothetical protein